MLACRGRVRRARNDAAVASGGGGARAAGATHAASARDGRFIAASPPPSAARAPRRPCRPTRRRRAASAKRCSAARRAEGMGTVVSATRPGDRARSARGRGAGRGTATRPAARGARTPRPRPGRRRGARARRRSGRGRQIDDELGAGGQAAERRPAPEKDAGHDLVRVALPAEGMRHEPDQPDGGKVGQEGGERGRAEPAVGALAEQPRRAERVGDAGPHERERGPERERPRPPARGQGRQAQPEHDSAFGGIFSATTEEVPGSVPRPTSASRADARWRPASLDSTSAPATAATPIERRRRVRWR